MLVPDAVRNKALVADAGAWLARLPSLVATIAREWSVEVGEPYGDATEAWVARATTIDGASVVLKLVVPRDGDAARNEITALRLADGVGCARLLRADAERGALLLERLGPSLFELGLPMTRRHGILVDTASRVWRPVAGCGLPTGADKGRWLAEFITTTWESVGRPCSERAVEHALKCVRQRVLAHDDERAVLVHGDVHQWNALAADDGFKLIDPDGLCAEAEYDLGIIMREDPDELLDDDPRARARWLAHRSGLDATAIWEWGVAERVSTGLILVSIGLEEVGERMLRAADHIATMR
jgi:streptomycin 6-kinase